MKTKIKEWIKRLLLWSGVQAYVDAIKAENAELTQKLKAAEVLKKRLAENLRSTLEARDTWRDTAIEYRRNEQYHIRRYENIQKGICELIRFDMVRSSGIVNMERAERGEYVKWKALDDIYRTA